MTFLGVLKAVGKGFVKGLEWALKYAIPVEKLVGLIFPAVAPETAVAVTVTTLIQSAVILVEQKWAALGQQDGTGAQKLADVMSLVSATVIQLLKQANIDADAAYVQRIVNAVVAVLNVQNAPAALAAEVSTEVVAKAA